MEHLVIRRFLARIIRPAAATLLVALMAGTLPSCLFWIREYTDAPHLNGHPVSSLSCRQVVPPESTVTWIEAPRERDRRITAAWCAAVGPSVVVSDDSKPTASLDSLAILSWNVHVGGGDLTGFVDDLRHGELTDGRPVDHFVILIQEVFRGGANVPDEVPDNIVSRRIVHHPPTGERLDIVDAAGMLGLNLFYVPSMRNGPPGSTPEPEDRGNAILSTLPLSDLTAIELPFEFYRRVAVAAAITGVTTAGEPWKLHVCSTHLATRTGFPRYFVSVGTGRLRQAKAIVAALPDSQVVLGGDFNTWALGSIEGTLHHIRRYYRQPTDLDGKGTARLPLFPDRRIDYLFFRLPAGRTARYHRIDDAYGSDHYPLIGWVQLADSPIER
jgi:endonuclease/exonuclease/phosphatase family metal-dependent hydrolase